MIQKRQGFFFFFFLVRIELFFSGQIFLYSYRQLPRDWHFLRSIPDLFHELLCIFICLPIFVVHFFSRVWGKIRAGNKVLSVGTAMRRACMKKVTALGVGRFFMSGLGGAVVGMKNGVYWIFLLSSFVIFVLSFHILFVPCWYSKAFVGGVQVGT